MTMTAIIPLVLFHKYPSHPQVERVVFVTGKHYYALARHAEEGGLGNVAFVRLEQLCPFPTKELQEAVAPFKRAKSEYQIEKRD